jgi:radical SAM protein with 4Fe4S-binding SPASM domain
MKFQSYNIFWQRIHKAAKNKGFPLRIMFELTYRCNFYCKHCYIPQSYRNYNELKTKEVLSILDQLADIGCFYLGFTGGEPFIREDILDILWYAKRLGFEIIIYTNGFLIDEEIAKQLSLLRPNKVDITIPGMSRVAFERISGVSGSRDKVFKAIDLLHKKGVNLGFKACVLKENEKEISQIQDFAHFLGALHRLDDMLSPCLDGSKEPFKYRGTLLNANRRKSNANLRECLNKDISVHSRLISENSRLFKCGVGVNQAVITPQGELKMCLMIDYLNYKILENSLKDCWQRLKDLVSNIKPDENYQCDKCELAPFCKWCPAKGWLYNRNFTSCDPESRTFAEKRRGRTQHATCGYVLPDAAGQEQ